MVWQGSFSLDETTRRNGYNPEAVLGKLQKGMIFVDVGCGDGYFSLLAAKKVGALGRVYAIDIDALGIEKLQSRAKLESLINITAKAGRAEDTVFCSACADVVFFSMSLHDFEDPRKVLANAREMVKPSGWLVNLDWKKQDTPKGPPVNIRFSEKTVQNMLTQAGFCTVSVTEAGSYHYLVVGKPTL
ncbi:MAG: class I SAM-dependent methyltransferase [Nitrososphaerota archaeon]|jgi:ubiquinone/menaquinone biosynthesis C-methylase UbiE|nr:class I SAM-dependent methyltransferase [Nitrososphaerota archaeon]